MPKRFTGPEKWDDPWFWELSPQAKLLFLFLCDHCDNAGIIEVSFKLASSKIGLPVNENHLAELESRLHTLPCGKRIIIDFIRFQYGTISRDCKPHNPVFVSLAKHGIDLPYIQSLSKGSHKPNQTLTVGLSKPTRQEKEKEKEPDKEKERGVQGGEPNGLDLVFVRDLLATYRRPAHSRLTHLEESTLAEIIREHPRYRDEWDIIVTLKKKEPRYFPQSLSRLLSSWQETLDRANSWVPIPDGKPVKPSLMERIINELPG